ncbi:ligand-gated channel [Methylopila jiangsuensis]|uniref:Ligand-gated channel n=1 Tax=Methylopila jiangsuensis TaxID=586230 RepID=A0A9W6N3B5_9HYPH|nr:TonB-dependent siderophore receptor [Methylopila jiangsuensis]MDR6286137.1 iron complex outermembrane receptor protein [Methylopila jiangsuensis]GLK75897.1 ligand-gated channel [Methylopila jiangsuensis]
MIYKSGLNAALLAGVALAVIVQADRAAAQQAGVTQLEAIEVEGRGSSSTGASAGDGVAPVQGWAPVATTTGAKTDTALKLVPQSIGVVGRQQMDDLGAQKADEAVRYSAGVFAQPFGEDSDTNWFYIRGFDATQTGVYRDGMQLYNYAFGNFYQDSYLLERVEVLRGASSSLYGGGNVGGIINYVSKRPLDHDFSQIEVGIDNYPTGYGAFDINRVVPNGVESKLGALPPVWKYRVTGKLEGGDGYAKHEDGIRGVIQGAATYSPDAGTDFTFYANYQHVDQKHGGGDFLPYYGSVKNATSVDGTINLGRIGRRSNFSDPDFDRYDRRQAMVGYDLRHDVNDTWTFNSKARFAYADLKEALVYPFGWGFADRPSAGNTTLSPIPFNHATKAYSFTADNSVVGKFQTGGLDHTLLFGIDYKFYRIDEVQSSFGSPYLDEKTTLNQAGVYIQDQIRFGGGWIATLNGRYDRAWLDGDYDPLPFDTGADVSYNKGRFSGRAGLGYEFANGLVPYVSVASVFNPLVQTNNIQNARGVTIGREPFKPETGIQYEAGVKYAPTWFNGLFTAAVFDLKKENVVSGVTSATSVQTQLGEVRSRGVEFEAQANLTENWKFIGAFTAYELKILKGVSTTGQDLKGEQPFLVPEIIGSAFLDYTFTAGALKGVSLGGGVRYLGKSEATEPNTVKVPDATLFDVAARYEWDAYKVSLNVTNLFDKRYVSGCQGITVCSYGEGRRALLKASYTW